MRMRDQSDDKSLPVAGRTRRGQAAMEFLMTYGWAILIMLVVIAVLFYLGVFTGGSVPKRCILPAGFTCADYAFVINGQLQPDGSDIRIQNGDRIALVLLAVGG